MTSFRNFLAEELDETKLKHLEHAEDHGQAETEHRIERSVDQAEQELAEQRLGSNA